MSLMSWSEQHARYHLDHEDGAIIRFFPRLPVDIDFHIEQLRVGLENEGYTFRASEVDRVSVGHSPYEVSVWGEREPCRS